MLKIRSNIFSLRNVVTQGTGGYDRLFHIVSMQLSLANEIQDRYISCFNGRRSSYLGEPSLTKNLPLQNAQSSLRILCEDYYI